MTMGQLVLLLILGIIHRQALAIESNCKSLPSPTISRLKTIPTPPDNVVQRNAQFSCACDQPSSSSSSLIGFSLSRTCLQQESAQQSSNLCYYNASTNSTWCTSSKYTLSLAQQNSTWSKFAVTIVNASTQVDSGTYACDCIFALSSRPSTVSGAVTEVSTTKNTSSTVTPSTPGLSSTINSTSYVWLRVQSEPDVVQNFTCSSVNSRGFVVNWSAGPDGNSPLQRYSARLKALNANCATKDLTVDVSAASTSYSFSDLYSFCSYEVSVAARNEIGVGLSARVSCTTLADVPDRPICETSATSNSLNVSITPSRLNGVFASFDVELFELGRTPIDMARAFEVSSTIQLQNLQPYTEYMVRAYISNTQSRSLPCELSVRTSESIPDAVQNLQVSFVGNQAMVTFEPPARKNGEIRQYVIVACRQPLPAGEGCTEVKPGELKARRLSCSLPVTACSTYVFNVTAYTQIGSGPPAVKIGTSPDISLTDADRPVMTGTYNHTQVDYFFGPSTPDLFSDATLARRCVSISVPLKSLQVDGDRMRHSITLRWSLTSVHLDNFISVELRISRCVAKPRGSAALFFEGRPSSEDCAPTESELSSICVRLGNREMTQLRLELPIEADARLYAVALSAVYRSACDDISSRLVARSRRKAPVEHVSAPSVVTVYVPAALQQKTGDGSINTLVFILAGTIGGLAVIAVTISAIYWFKKRRNHQSDYQTITDNQAAVNGDGAACVDNGQSGGRSAPLLDDYDTVMENHLNKAEFVRRVALFHADSNALFANEYREINLVSQQMMMRGLLPSSASVDPANASKNRYSSILAFDRTRVKLKPGFGLPSNANRNSAMQPQSQKAPNASGAGRPGSTLIDTNGVMAQSCDGSQLEARSDYVNANYVDSYLRRCGYIATQGPLKSTFADFWSMVYQEGSNTIVMLTNLVEGRKHKCDKYWPDDCEQYGAFEVQFLNKQQRANYTVREFSLRERGRTGFSSGAPERIVRQFHFTNWPDDSTPPFVMPVLEFVRKSSDHAVGPIVVHCSAGVGRTGTYICIHSMIQQFERNGTLNVHGFLMHIRKQRNFLVHTEDQYVFVHDALLEYVECGSATEQSAAQLADYVRRVRQPRDSESGETELERQFELVSRFQPSPFECIAAHKPCNVLKNRSVTVVRVSDSSPGQTGLNISVTQSVRQQILPLDVNRVKVPYEPGQEGSDYVNASVVQGFQFDNEFIIAQAPFSEQTALDFWRAVWEYNSQLIVLFEPADASQSESDAFRKYWPLADVLGRSESDADRDRPGAFPNGLRVARVPPDYRFGDQITVQQFVITSARSDDYVLQTRAIVVHERWPDVYRQDDGEVSSTVFGLVLMAQYCNGPSFLAALNDYATLCSATGTWSNTMRTDFGCTTLPSNKPMPFGMSGLNTLPAGVLQTDIDAPAAGEVPANGGFAAPRFTSQLSGRSMASMRASTLKANGGRSDESRSPIVIVDRHGARQCAHFCALANLYAQFTDDHAFDVYTTAKMLHQQRPFVFNSAADLELLYGACDALVRDGPPTLTALERTGLLFVGTPPASPTSPFDGTLNGQPSFSIVDLPPAFGLSKTLAQPTADGLQSLSNGAIAKRRSVALNPSDVQIQSQNQNQISPATQSRPGAAAVNLPGKLSAQATGSASKIETPSASASAGSSRPTVLTKACSEPPSDDIIITPPRTAIGINNSSSPTKAQPSDVSDKLRSLAKAVSVTGSLHNQSETNVDDAEDDDHVDIRRPLLNKNPSEVSRENGAERDREPDLVRESGSKNLQRSKPTAETQIELDVVRCDNPRV